jgi:RNA polymerase sigma-70 factor, ECF subfamily
LEHSLKKLKREQVFVPERSPTLAEDEPSQLRARTRDAAGWTPSQRECFHALYRDHFDFVFRNLRRLGVADHSLDDALQDVFLIVLRRFDSLAPGSHIKAWLFAILLRVAGNHRRSWRRKGITEPICEDYRQTDQPDPFDLAARAQAARFLNRFLDELDETKRAVFVMAELEQMTAPEIAQALTANVNTVYSWLRGTRIQFVARLASLRSGEKSHG